ncbi:MAG: CaiB/BaiF CoA-transferase family protein [Gemmatimonadaceae bacterium]
MLSGTRILDLTRVLAGPLCTMRLGDMGADVIKVERTAGGDETRGWGPPFDERGASAYFLSVNRNKKSIALDFGVPADVALLVDLIGGADVVVENFLPGVLTRHGLAPDGLLRRHDALIWCTIGGFGPESRRPGYDFVVQAECGWMAITGPRDGPPTKHGVALADVVAGKDAAIAILAALVARGRGARAPEQRRLHISLAASAAAALINVAQNTLVGGDDAKRWGNAHANLVPYQLFEAADRPIVVAVGSDAQWQACARALGLPALASDARLATNAGRLAHRAEVVGALAARLTAAPAAVWLASLDAAGVPCGLVRGVREVLAATNASPLTGMPPSVPGSIRMPPPHLDEHGVEIRQRGWHVFPTV